LRGMGRMTRGLRFFWGDDGKERGEKDQKRGKEWKRGKGRSD
jgi:hypothetical protein